MPGTAETEEVLDETGMNDSSQQQAKSDQVWVKNHATSTDMEATDIFIKIVGSHKYQSLLNDKRTLKFKVWEDVYEDMVRLGYNIAKDRKEGGMKCSQKWRNLERSCVQFVGQVQAKNIVKKMKKLPIHYEQLREVFKDGHNTHILELTNPLFAEKEQKCQSLDVNSDASKGCNIIKLQASVLAPSRHKKGAPLWVKRNPSAEDLEATDTFIKIVGSDKYQALLSNRKTRKCEVWQAVCEEMTKLGYNVAENKVDGGVRCSQKWRNLERAYIQYVTSPQADRADKKRRKKPPVQYDLLHAVLKDRIDVIHSEMNMESSPSVEKLEPELQSTFTSSCDTSKECHDDELQSVKGDTAESPDQTKEGEYIIVEFSPDIENMLGMNVGNKNEQQHTENEGSQKESTSVSKAMRESSGEQLWATNHATATDLEATTAFIKIVGSDRFQLLLNDRKTRKSQVWQQVYQQMIKLGYRVSESLKDGGIKCAQKWRNLERSYIQYVGQIKTAGVNKRKKNRKPPLHYEELHAILKGKNFTNYDETVMPSGTTNEYEQRTYNSDIDMPEDLPTSFSSSRNIKTSEATPQDVLDFVVNEAKKQEKQFAKLCEILNRQNDEKKRLTDAIIAYLGQPLEPRKRKASDTDSD